MAAEKVNIASLTIDYDDVIKESAKLKTNLDALKKSQKELDVTTEEGSKAFVKNEVQIKKLSKAYRDNQQFAVSLDAVNKDLTKTMSTEGKTTQQLRDDRRNLNQVSKQILGNTEEEIILREQLNVAIDEQTEALREQSSEFNASKDGIGEYKEGIKAAFDEMNVFNGGLSGFIERSQDAGGTGKLFTNGLKGMTAGLKSVTKASLQFIATPIGAVLAAIVLVFALIKNAMNRSEESTNKIKKAFSAFSGILKGLLKILAPVGDFLIDGLVVGFELLEKAVFKALDAIASGLEFLGLDSAAESLRNFTTAIEESAAASKALAEAEIALEKAERIAQKTQLDYQKTAEKFRQIRDDETKTIKERIQANEDLGLVLKDQLRDELAIAQQALLVAELRIQADGETKEALDGQAEALTRIADIQERITGQESEQIVNRVSLQKEAAEKFKEIQDKAIQKQKDDLALFIAQQGKRAKTLQENLAIEEEVSKKKIEILEAELENKNITQAAFDAESLEIQNDLLLSRAELTEEFARLELENYIQNNESKLDSEKFLTEAAVEEERRRLDLIAEQRKEFEKLRLEEGIISETEYNAAINEINEENRLSNAELDEERKEAAEEQRTIDFENELILQDLEGASKLELLTAQLEADRKAEVKAAERTGADIDKINKKYGAFQKKVDTQIKNERLSTAADTFGGIAQLLGEHTAAGKAAAIAQATINTFLGISEIWAAKSVLPEPIATYFKIANTVIAGASGIANVVKIKNTKAPTLAKGGVLNGASHANGGIKAGGVEFEGGEAVINKASTRRFAPLLSKINEAGGGVKFANGGILGSTSQPSNSFDVNLIADRLAEANSALPSPIVSVEEINSVNSDVSVIESDSTL